MDGTITARDLLETTSLGLELLAGEAGLDRQISWAHVSELEDPATWMDGGELLVTNGMGIPEDADGQVAFLRRLHERKVAGLLVGIRAELQAPALRAADELEFPVVRVPLRTPFVPIMRMVIAANQDPAHRKLLVSLRIFDTLSPRAEPISSRERFRQVEEISGYRLYLVTPWGSPLLPGFAGVPDEVIPALAGIVGDDAATPAVPGGYAAPVHVGSRLAGVLVALERSGATPTGLGTLRSIVTIASLELGELYRVREVQRRKGAELLTKLLAAEYDEEQDGESLESVGLLRSQPFVLVAAEERRPTDCALDDEINHQLSDHGVPHLMAGTGDRVFLAMAADEVEVLGEIAERLSLMVGISAEHGSFTMCPVARREAVWAIMQARRRPGGAEHEAVQFSTDEGAGHWLPADIPALTNMVERVIGPLLSYDFEHSTALLQSLRVFFERDRRLKDAADALYVHKHTLAYRLKRIEQLTGRNLSTVDDQTELWLALKAMDVVGGDTAQGA